MLPKTLALVDDDHDYAEYLSQHLRSLGTEVDVFSDGSDLLVSLQPYGYDFYVVDLTLPGIDGLQLIKMLRRRTSAGVLVVSGRLGADVFKEVVGAGADMYLVKPVQFEQVALAIEAVHRRARAIDGVQSSAWRLDRRAGQLIAPDGACIELSDADRVLLECFLEARGELVTRDTLCARLGQPAEPERANGLNATIFRLRRRIERATSAPAPLHTKSRAGYIFRAELSAS